MKRVSAAWKAFWQILGSQAAADAWQKAGEMADRGGVLPAAADAQTPARSTEDNIRADAVYTLVLLQREGRLIDFLQEDIAAFSDEQVGAAVRRIHAGCRKVLAENFAVEPIVSGPEGEQAEVKVGFDPSAIRLIGCVAGDPPFNGTVKHRGWRVSKVCFPQRHAKVNSAVICPAEIEI